MLASADAGVADQVAGGLHALLTGVGGEVAVHPQDGDLPALRLRVDAAQRRQHLLRGEPALQEVQPDRAVHRLGHRLGGDDAVAGQGEGHAVADGEGLGLGGDAHLPGARGHGRRSSRSPVPPTRERGRTRPVQCVDGDAGHPLRRAPACHGLGSSVTDRSRPSGRGTWWATISSSASANFRKPSRYSPHLGRRAHGGVGQHLVDVVGGALGEQLVGLLVGRAPARGRRGRSRGLALTACSCSLRLRRRCRRRPRSRRRSRTAGRAAPRA